MTGPASTGRHLEPTSRPREGTVFVWEYLCSGACPEANSQPSLAREGRAMLLAFLEDCAGIPDTRTMTVWNHRLGPFPVAGIEVHLVTSPAEEAQAFEHLAKRCRTSMLIAPEFDDLLLSRSEKALQCGGRLAGCSPEAVQLCGDKLATYRRLQSADIRTIFTRPFDESTSIDESAWPAVLKPRYGAGSLATRMVRDAVDFQRQAAAIRADAANFPLIVQPYVPGRAVSLAVLMGPRGPEPILPVAEQRLSEDGRFQYLGGRIPGTIASTQAQAIRELALRAASCIEGLHGYVGFDFVLPHSDDQPVLVEINPRLTTAYVGYRQLAGENLAARLLADNAPPLPATASHHFQAGVEFDSDGTFRLLGCSQPADHAPHAG